MEDGSGDKDFFTIVPNYILNHSTAVDQALYLQMKRLAGDGKKDYCYPSFNYLGKQLHIGEKALKKSLEYLIFHKWIENLGPRRVHTAGGMQWVNAYRINNIWRLNTDYYKGGAGSDYLEKGALKDPKVAPKDGEVVLVVEAKQERNKELKKEQVIFSLKDWNERQPSPIPDFKPENIVNKHGVEKIEGLVKIYGKMNGGFSKFLQALKGQ